jgi:hypothetical protein
MYDCNDDAIPNWVALFAAVAEKKLPPGATARGATD